MSKDERERTTDTGGPNTKKRKPWFGPSRAGVGFRPYAWQGRLILVVIVAAIVTVVVLFRTGVL